MSAVKKSISLFLMVWVVVLWGCNNDIENKGSRPFYLGFTPFPYDISQEAVDYSYQKIAEDADIVNHHFDDGVPWIEALANQPFHVEIQNDWAYRKSHTPASHKVYLSVTSINFLRTGLASYRSANPNQELPPPWNTYRFNQAEVKQAYLTYCKRIVDFFDPDYFNMAIEANLLHVNNPSLWADYLELHKYVYAELKKSYPGLPIFTSFAGLHLIDGFIDVNETIEKVAVEQVLPYSDYFAISMYPYLTSYLGSDFPQETYHQLFSMFDKPLAIAETGFAAQEFSVDVGGGVMANVKGTADRQNKYVQNLLEACTQYKAAFVINFVVRDYDELWKEVGSPTDLTIAWRDSGLYDENGTARPALATWKNFLQKEIKP
jgi:hypothetical protein